MIRSLFGLLVVIGVLLLPGTVLAHPGPPRPTPTPHTQQTALTGRVPAPSGTAVTLKVMDLDVGLFKDCETSTSLAGPDGFPETSSFQFVLDGSCLAGTEGVFVCWSPRREDCALVAVSTGWRSVASPRFDLPSFAELGPTLDTGLLTSIPTEPAPDQTIVPPEAHDLLPGEGAALDNPADAGQQITASSASGPGPGQQVADLSQTEQGARYDWLLWAGAALLVAGLALGAALRVRARRS